MKPFSGGFLRLLAAGLLGLAVLLAWFWAGPLGGGAFLRGKGVPGDSALRSPAGREPGAEPVEKADPDWLRAEEEWLRKERQWLYSEARWLLEHRGAAVDEWLLKAERQRRKHKVLTALGLFSPEPEDEQVREWVRRDREAFQREQVWQERFRRWVRRGGDPNRFSRHRKFTRRAAARPGGRGRAGDASATTPGVP